MTTYRAPSGALVFSAGTIQWAWALDGNHDRGSAAADTAAQQATVNLLRRHGGPAGHAAPPVSPRPPRPPTRPRPRPTITSPAAGATLPVGTPVTISGTATDTGGGRVAGVEVSTDNGATWRRATGRGSWTYTFTPSSSGAADPARPRRRRQRPPRHRGDHQRHRRDRGDHLPVHDLAGHRDAGRHRPRHEPGRARREVPRQRRRPDHRHPLLQARRRPPAAHVGSLWSSTGTRLGQVTFTNESASGWQQASFATPDPGDGRHDVRRVLLHPEPGTPSARATSRAHRPRAARSRRCRTAPTEATASTATPRPPAPSPTRHSARENYWVDVVFTEANDTAKPTVTARTPAPGATGVAAGQRRHRDVLRAGPAVDHRVRAAGARRSRRSRHDVATTRPAARRRSTRRRRSPPRRPTPRRSRAPATPPATRWTRSRGASRPTLRTRPSRR